MLFEGFIHPALAWGALLASVPLLIHLLNRQRHRPLQWAAMRFVMAAYKRTRRRAQMENLLLLLLRMLAVALLALAVSRPFTGKDSPLAPLTESRRDVVLILDSSASTGYREGVQSVYESILDRGREILADYDGTRGDRVRLISAAATPRLLSARSPEDALALLSTLSTPTDESLDMTALLTEVVRLAEEEAAGAEESALEVRFLSDLQKRSFLSTWAEVGAQGGPGAGPAAAGEGDEEELPPLTRALDRLEELGVSVVVEDLGPGELTPPNLGLELVGPTNEILGSGILSEITVRVRNHGSTGRAAVRVALEVDGQRQPSQKIDIPARAAADVIFPYLFRAGGAHTLVARLEGDRLAVDDTRAAVLAVPAPIHVLLVNGDPHPEIDRDEIGYVRTALEPPSDSLAPSGLYSPFAVTVVNATGFGNEELQLAEYDVLFLANVGSLSQRLVERIESRVAAGASLILTLGDRLADPSAIEGFNARMWRPDQTGLLPAKLFRKVEVKSRRDAYYRCSWFDEEHPALSFFADERWRAYLTEVPIYAFVSTEASATGRVLARLDDEDKSPLLLERDYDRGRVFLWTTSIDTDWNRVAESPKTLIPFTHELRREAGRGPAPRRNVDVGAPLALEAESFPRSPTVVAPNGSRRPLDGESVEVAEGVWQLPAVPVLDRAGLWRVEWEGTDVPFSVELDAAEGNLERLGPGELSALHRAWHVYEASDDGRADEDDRPDRGEIWRWLAAMALLALILETLWAAWIGRARRVH
jgi:hypothetical protein